MPSAPTDLRYHADAPLLQAATVWVEPPDGHPYGRFHRRTTRNGLPRWRWTGTGLDDFVLEAPRLGASFLVTEPHGAPFGRILQRGLLRPRLVAADADDERFSIELDGRIHPIGGARTPQGILELRRDDHLCAALPATDDGTLAALLLVAPLCHAAQAVMLEAA